MNKPERIELPPLDKVDGEYEIARQWVWSTCGIDTPAIEVALVLKHDLMRRERQLLAEMKVSAGLREQIAHLENEAADQDGIVSEGLCVNGEKHERYVGCLYCRVKKSEAELQVMREQQKKAIGVLMAIATPSNAELSNELIALLTGQQQEPSK